MASKDYDGPEIEDFDIGEVRIVDEQPPSPGAGSPVTFEVPLRITVYSYERNHAEEISKIVSWLGYRLGNSGVLNHD